MRTIKKIQRPRALLCGMLKDGGRIFFLSRNERGVVRFEMPCIYSYGSEDPVNLLSEEFNKQTGIDGEVCSIVLEKRHNAGSRRRKYWIPCLVFEIKAKNKNAKISKEFSGYKWLSLEDAKKEKLSRKSEWIRKS